MEHGFPVCRNLYSWKKTHFGVEKKHITKRDPVLFFRYFAVLFGIFLVCFASSKVWLNKRPNKNSMFKQKQLKTPFYQLAGTKDPFIIRSDSEFIFPGFDHHIIVRDDMLPICLVENMKIARWKLCFHLRGARTWFAVSFLSGCFKITLKRFTWWQSTFLSDVLAECVNFFQPLLSYTWESQTCEYEEEWNVFFSRMFGSFPGWTQ